MEDDLSRFRWENRLLFLFAPDERHASAALVKAEVDARREEMLDRDLVFFELFATGTSRMNAQPIPSATAAALWARFSPQPDAATLVLVGKDGGVKLTRRDPEGLDEVFARIDAMPMRQIEIRRRQQSK